MCTISDVPYDLYPMVFDYKPKLKVISIQYPRSIAAYVLINCNIEYIDHHINTTIRMPAYRNQDKISAFRDMIDDFIDQVNKKIPSIFNTKTFYWNNITHKEDDWEHGLRGGDMEIDYFGDKCVNKWKGVRHVRDSDYFTYQNLLPQFHKGHNTKIVYTQNYYKINNIILGSNAHDCVIDLLNCMKQAIEKPFRDSSNVFKSLQDYD